MKILIKSKKYRGYLLLASYVALCMHFMAFFGYYSSLSSPAMPTFTYFSFLVISSICIVMYVLLPLSNGSLWVAILKAIIGLLLLIFDPTFPTAIIYAFTAYFLLAFYDMYVYKVKI